MLDYLLSSLQPETAYYTLSEGSLLEEYRMNSDQLQGKWKELKGAVRERWGKLTDDDLDVISGQQEQLIGRIQNRYGIAKDAAQKEVDEWMNTGDFTGRKAG